MPVLFRTKICGVTSSASANVVVASGADAIGFNFYPNGKRYITPGLAREISAALPESLARVGVFVNASVEYIRGVWKQVDLDFVQLHGNESPGIVDQLSDLPVIRAFRCPAGTQPVADFLLQCRTLPCAVLIDSFDPGKFGGTGRIADWAGLVETRNLIGEIPMILAGGLTPDNVKEAIAQVRPDGVDTASGVEKERCGEKDVELSQRFVASALAAWGN